MNRDFNYDNDIFDLSEEYFNQKNGNPENLDNEYFPLEESKPPHY